MLEDSEEGVLFDEEVDIDIKKLPNLVITQIVWEDENGNELVSFSDGSVGYAKIHVMNEGSFDVTANAEISLTKSGKDFAKGYDTISSILTERGLTLHTLDMSQFRAADGSLTCLSLLYD